MGAGPAQGCLINVSFYRTVLVKGDVIGKGVNHVVGTYPENSWWPGAEWTSAEDALIYGR